MLIDIRDLRGEYLLPINIWLSMMGVGKHVKPICDTIVTYILLNPVYKMY